MKTKIRVTMIKRGLNEVLIVRIKEDNKKNKIRMRINDKEAGEVVKTLIAKMREREVSSDMMLEAEVILENLRTGAENEDSTYKVECKKKITNRNSDETNKTEEER